MSPGTESSELSELEGEGDGLPGEGGVYLDLCGFGPKGEAGSSPQGRTPSVGLWPGSLAPPQREGRRGGGHLANTRCPSLPPCQGPLPLMSRAIQGATVPFAFPEAAAAGGNSPRAWQRGSSLTRRPAQGKARPPPSKHFNLSGPEGQSDLLPRGHTAGRAWDGTGALLRSTANPSLPF